MELDFQQEAESCSDIQILFMDEVLWRRSKWFRLWTLLHDRKELELTVAGMYGFLAVLIFSSTTGFNMKRSFYTFLERKPLGLKSEPIMYILRKFLGNGATGRGADGSAI